MSKLHDDLLKGFVINKSEKNNPDLVYWKNKCYEIEEKEVKFYKKTKCSHIKSLLSSKSNYDMCTLKARLFAAGRVLAYLKSLPDHKTDQDIQDAIINVLSNIKDIAEEIDSFELIV